MLLCTGMPQCVQYATLGKKKRAGRGQEKTASVGREKPWRERNLLTSEGTRWREGDSLYKSVSSDFSTM